MIDGTRTENPLARENQQAERIRLLESALEQVTLSDDIHVARSVAATALAVCGMQPVSASSQRGSLPPGAAEGGWDVPSGWRNREPWFKVGDQVVCQYPMWGRTLVCTVTEITPQGFKYTHEKVPTGSPWWGTAEGGETYEPSGYRLNAVTVSEQR